MHTHGFISSNLQHGAHTQNAGKLIIDLDEQADKLKSIALKKKEELDNFQKYSADTLKESFTDKEQEFYQTYKNAPKKAKDKLAANQKTFKDLEASLGILNKLNNKNAEINRLALINKIFFSSSLSSKKIYIELFTREIKEKAQDEADHKIKAHFEKHKQLIEEAKDQIPKNYKAE